MVPTRLTQRSDAERHDIVGEPDVKTGGKGIENQQEAMNMMMMMVERMQQEQRAMTEMKAAVERLVRRNGEFNGNDVSRYLRDYKGEMMRCGIPEGLQVISFSRVATDELQERIYKIRQQNSTWGSNSKTTTVQMVSLRIGLKSKEYAKDMIRGRREYCQQQHGL